VTRHGRLIYTYYNALIVGAPMELFYAIRGGRSGRERLRVLSHVLQAGTLNFLDNRAWLAWMLDVAAGMLLASCRGVWAAGGRVVGLDMDKSSWASSEGRPPRRTLQMSNIALPMSVIRHTTSAALTSSILAFCCAI
jgi:hypothetical protein